MHDVVALLEEMSGKQFLTGTPLLLPRGQIGTVVMTYGGSAFDVEFADRDGKTFAILFVPPENLILLHETPQLTAASDNKVPRHFQWSNKEPLTMA